MWDANYRESIEDTLQCLQKQTIIDKLDIYYIEWTSTVNPVMNECDFVTCININSNMDFDTGVQWNLGLFLAQTEWVAYHHCDIVPADHYEKIFNRIESIEKNNLPTIWIEGWNINLPKRANHSWNHEYVEYKKKVNNKLWLLPTLYRKEKPRKPHGGGFAFTVHKTKFIKEVNGWCWGRKTKLWCGPAWPQPNLPNNQNVREYLRKKGKAEIGMNDIYVYVIPHPRIGTYEPQHPISSSKYYEDLINKWLPEHTLTLDGKTMKKK